MILRRIGDNEAVVLCSISSLRQRRRNNGMDCLSICLVHVLVHAYTTCLSIASLFATPSQHHTSREHGNTGTLPPTTLTLQAHPSPATALDTFAIQVFHPPLDMYARESQPTSPAPIHQPTPPSAEPPVLPANHLPPTRKPTEPILALLHTPCPIRYLACHITTLNIARLGHAMTANTSIFVLGHGGPISAET